MGSVLHHFYVSKTIINYLPDKGAVEITMRFFTDDLSKAVSGFAASEVNVSVSDPDTFNAVAAYIEQHFSASVNGKVTRCNWVGMEAESDLTYCYLEISVGEPLRTMDVMHDGLMEVFPEQQNIVDFSTLSTTQTAILVKGSCRHSFTR